MNNNESSNTNHTAEAVAAIVSTPWYRNWKTYAYIGAGIVLVAGAAYAIAKTGSADAVADAAADAIGSAADAAGTAVETTVEAVA